MFIFAKTNYKTMKYFKSFSEKLLNQEVLNFEEMAFEMFKFQSVSNPVYHNYIKARNMDPESVRSLEEIPFLPINFFKDHQVISGSPDLFPFFYSSSGTTGVVTSKHFIWSEEFYLQHALRVFQMQYGPIEDFHVLALLPSYLERKGSSLVSMAAYFIEQSGSVHSGFYLYNHRDLANKLLLLQNGNRKVLLLGVTFALLDFAEMQFDLPQMDNLILMETGGMKGRRREMVREEVHEILKNAFGVPDVHSEYGMTELMSQAYSKGGGKYTMPSTMHVLLRDVNDPFNYIKEKTQGGINIIDLANFHSCAFIETQDLGRYAADGKLEVMGRFDNSEVRGCNLMIN